MPTGKKIIKTINELKPRANPIQERAEKTREKILQAAINIIDEQGMGALTTRRIATTTNMAIASVYRYFPNKEAILYSIIQQWYDRIIDIYKEFDNIDTSTITWRDFFISLDNAFFNLPEITAGYHHWSLIASKYSVPELQTLEEAHEERIVQYSIKFLKKFGSAWSTTDLKNVARVVYHTFEAGVMLSFTQTPSLAKHTIALCTDMYIETYRKCLETP